MAKTTSTRKKRRKATRPPSSRKRVGGLLATQRKFLDAFLKTARIKAAADAVGIDRQLHYRDWLKDERYKKAYEAVYAELEKRNADESLEIIEELSDPMRGWTEEVVEEEVEPVKNPETGETEMRVTKAKRRRVKRFSVAAALWRGNRYHGNPARLEVSGPGGGPIEGKMSLEQLRAFVDGASQA